MNTDEIAWAAGLFEGEGTAYIVRQGRNLRAQLKVVMSDRDVVLRFQKAVGIGKVRGPDYHWGKTPMYRWQANRWNEIVKLAELFKPYLGSRRLQQLERIFTAGCRPLWERTNTNYEELPPDCGYCKPGEATARGYRMHKKKGIPLCKGCYLARFNYYLKRRMSIG